MSKRAIILAGGKGTRLKPYSVIFPKPLVPIGEYPILEIIIRQLVKHRFDHITITVNHLAELIETFFGNGSKWGIKIDYSFEDEPLGTMGPLKLIQNLPDNFLVMNGDVLTDLDFSEFYTLHIKHKNIFTISAVQREERNEYGILEINDKNVLINFKEKPLSRYLVSMGIYMVHKKILSIIPKNHYYGFDHLMHEMIKTNMPPVVNIFSGKWLDIGRPDDYARAIDEFKTHNYL